MSDKKFFTVPIGLLRGLLIGEKRLIIACSSLLIIPYIVMPYLCLIAMKMI